MRARQYLPSAQFALVVASIALAGGLIAGAQYVTRRPAAPTLAATQTSAAAQDWRATLEEIQANSGVSLPQTPSPGSVAQLIAGAQSGNLTDSVGKTLLVKLTNAKAQGLGDDIPTQDQLVSQALAEINSATSTVYTKADLTVVPQTKDSLHTYGNRVMAIFAPHPRAQAGAVLMALGYAVDYRDASKLQPLADAQTDYAALADDLASLPVPETLEPLHLQAVNDLADMAAAIRDMRTVLSDPLRGLSGLQRFNALADEATRVLTTIAGAFGKNGILFTKDEPGASWSAFVSGP